MSIFKMEALTVKDGLSQGMINCMRQDHLGFMWFGTLDGLNRYDGYRFTTFRHNYSDSTSISGNFITSIFEDSRKRLWVGTALNGLNLFDAESETFIRFQHNNLNILKNSRVLSIQEDRNGAIWVGTVNGLFKIITKEKKGKRNFSKLPSPDRFFENNEVIITKIILDKANPSHELFRTHEKPAAMQYLESIFYIDTQGVVWVSVPGALYKIFPSAYTTDSVVSFNDDKLVFSNDNVLNISQDTSMGLIHLMHLHSITTVDQKNGSVSTAAFPNYNIGITRRQLIINGNEMWAAHNHKLFRHNLGTGKAEIIRPQSSDHAKMMGYCNHVYRDKSGVIWIGTSGFGLLKFNPHALQFNMVNTKSVIWMGATPENNVLANAVDFILLSRNNSSGKYYPDSLFSEKMKKWFPVNPPDIGAQTNDKNYYINASYIIKFNNQSKAYLTISDSAFRFPFFVDRDENIWYGLADSLCKFNTKTNQVIAYKYPVAKITTFPYHFLESLYQDGNGILWLGTVNGLFRFDERNKSWKQYINNPGDKESLSTDVIFSICGDIHHPEYLWIGTNGGGLNLFNKKTESFRNFSERDGLSNNVVYGILNANSGNLWMSTNNGLSRFTPPDTTNLKGIFRNYNEDDGLQSNEFNRYAYAKTNSGLLFFGGVNGYNYFDPEKIQDPDYTPRVIITDFKLSNKPVPFSDTSGKKNLLNKPVFLTDRIVLSYHSNMMTFDFAEMEFTNPAKNKFQYKMEGFDTNWVQPDMIHSATFTNLDPGKYTFIVRSVSATGKAYNNETSVIIIIRPPWYMTWWFRFFAIAVAVTGIYSFYRYRINETIKLMEMRNRIANDLHDEIGSSLSSVHIYSEVALHKTLNRYEEIVNHLNQISSETSNMIEALNDIVWAVNPKNDRFENIINRMRAATVELFEVQNMCVHHSR
ncbi:MAG: hypothetical protein KIT80_02025 [Chitinophagaceae bacterium]|nr:hypothetical protein [Chitinophagaceae bacterium]MCW5925662.1 hypothetical protein [Chitinophagaceae bacterium]